MSCTTVVSLGSAPSFIFITKVISLCSGNKWRYLDLSSSSVIRHLFSNPHLLTLAIQINKASKISKSAKMRRYGIRGGASYHPWSMIGFVCRTMLGFRKWPNACTRWRRWTIMSSCWARCWVITTKTGHQTETVTSSRWDLSLFFLSFSFTLYIFLSHAVTLCVQELYERCDKLRRTAFKLATETEDHDTSLGNKGSSWTWSQTRFTWGSEQEKQLQTFRHNIHIETKSFYVYF